MLGLELEWRVRDRDFGAERRKESYGTRESGENILLALSAQNVAGCNWKRFDSIETAQHK